MIGGVSTVYFYVQDMSRAVAFYRRLLRAEPRYHSEHWTDFLLGDVRLGLHATGGEPVPPVPRGPHGAKAGAILTLRVSDLEAEVERLRAADVAFLYDVTAEEWGKITALEDPDGNIIELTEPPPT